MWKEFREFAVKGNVIDLAVGIIIGAAFGSIVRSLVDDIIMPPIGMLLGNVDFTGFMAILKEGALAGPYANPAAAKEAGAVTINYGNFINNIITFLIVAFSVFLLIKGINQFKKKQSEIPPESPITKECPYCFSKISIKATKCPECTSELKS